MRHRLGRVAVLCAFAVLLASCGGSGLSSPYTVDHGVTFASGANGQALLRFIQGSPDVPGTNGTVDVCVDQKPFGLIGGAASYGRPATSIANSGTLVSIPAGIGHTISVFMTVAGMPGQFVGGECATAPGPYLGQQPLVITTITPAVNSRWTIVLGGTHATNTFGLYAFIEPSFSIAPAGNEVISHNAAPAYSLAHGGHVGFGTCSASTVPCATAATLIGAGYLSPPRIAGVRSAMTIAAVTSPLPTIPAGFYDGIGVPSGTVAPVTASSAPSSVAGQPYVIDLYSIDAPASGLGLVSVTEQTLGYGF
jgi:hypothetical protein